MWNNGYKLKATGYYMKYTDIRLSDLRTYEDHQDAISSIESNFKNYIGGIGRWNSGLETVLLNGAKKKIASIQAREDRLFPVCTSCCRHTCNKGAEVDGDYFCKGCLPTD